MSVWITKEIDLGAFQVGICTGRNTVSPVMVSSPDPCDPQTALDYHENISQGIQSWASWAVVAGIAQYAARHETEMNLLGLPVVFYRTPTFDEVHLDRQELGGQVEAIQEEDSPEWRVAAGPCEGAIYSGPERVEGVVVSSYAFSGPVPEDMGDSFSQLEEVTESGEMLVPQTYQFFHASPDGEVHYLAFAKPENFNWEERRYHGKLEVKGSELFWRPGESIDQPLEERHSTDFSTAWYIEH
ncbi:MAG: hypothetical protein QGH82_01390 [Candidatus Woesearchaeota archaeon]|nr:hypothetical protein [Candidatus Woesearchaeota archaeon]